MTLGSQVGREVTLIIETTQQGSLRIILFPKSRYHARIGWIVGMSWMTNLG